jgi:hypothetical protein
VTKIVKPIKTNPTNKKIEKKALKYNKQEDTILLSDLEIK